MWTSNEHRQVIELDFSYPFILFLLNKLWKNLLMKLYVLLLFSSAMTFTLTAFGIMTLTITAFSRTINEMLHWVQCHSIKSFFAECCLCLVSICWESWRPFSVSQCNWWQLDFNPIPWDNEASFLPLCCHQLTFVELLYFFMFGFFSIRLAQNIWKG